MQKLYSYKTTQNLKTSVDIGEITPVYWNVLHPNEEFSNLSFQNITRMITPFYPTLDNAKFDLYFFGVPKRILYSDDFKRLWPDGRDLTLRFDKKLINGVFNRPNREYYKLTKYLDTPNYISSAFRKFGFNTESMKTSRTDGVYLNISYILAYWKVYESFFMNKKFEKFNYFTWFNDLCLKGKIDVIYYNDVSNWDPNTSLSTNSGVSKSDHIGAMRLLDTLGFVNTESDFLDSIIFNNFVLPLNSNWQAFKNTIFTNYVKNVLNTSKLSSATIKDTLIKIWNANNQDKTNPILLGWNSWQQSINQVVNTAKQTNTDGSINKNNALGDIGGMSVTINEGNSFGGYKVNEETIVLGLLVPNFKMHVLDTYDIQEWTTINSSDSNSVKYYNKFNPAMEYAYNPLSYDSFYSSDKFTDTTIQQGLSNASNFKDYVLGFVPAYDYLRNKKDVIAGDVMDKWSNWTYALDIDSLESVKSKTDGAAFKDFKIASLMKVYKKPFKDTLIAPDQDSFLCEFNFKTKIMRFIKPLNIIIDSIVKGN